MNIKICIFFEIWQKSKRNTWTPKFVNNARYTYVNVLETSRGQMSCVFLIKYCISVNWFLELTLWNVWCFASQYFRESILSDIRKARNLYTGKELAAELARIRQRVDNIEVLTADIVINLLLSYRDIQVRGLSVTLRYHAGGGRDAGVDRQLGSKQSMLLHHFHCQVLGFFLRASK